MPWAPNRPCREPLCSKLIGSGGYCEEHRKANDRRYNRDRRRDPNREDGFYSSTAWRRLRIIQLREHPLCADCLRDGRMTPATVADHKIPIKQGGAALDPSNLQSLCSSCHSRKSALEGSRWGLPRGGGWQSLEPHPRTAAARLYLSAREMEEGGIETYRM